MQPALRPNGDDNRGRRARRRFSPPAMLASPLAAKNGSERGGNCLSGDPCQECPDRPQDGQRGQPPLPVPGPGRLPKLGIAPIHDRPYHPQARASADLTGRPVRFGGASGGRGAYRGGSSRMSPEDRSSRVRPVRVRAFVGALNEICPARPSPLSR